MKCVVLSFALAGVAACGGAASSVVVEEVMVDAKLKRELEIVSRARVYFGHQSVGANLLDGLSSIAKEAGVPVALRDQTVGENRDPLSKFEAFARYAESPESVDDDLLLMKLCYVDFAPDTDVSALLQSYVSAIERVRVARPEARIVHVTPPLCARSSDLKTKLKRGMGRAIWEDEASLRRKEFRDLLLAQFPGEPVFDLALVESTRPDGTREVYDVRGEEVPFLWPGYTTDGGHLNEAAGRVAARAFAETLANALR